jgi:hypothetical protein
LANENRAQQLDQICYSSLAGHSFASLFTGVIKVSECAGEKPFCSAKLAYIHFSSSICTLQGPILRTGGHALPSAP